MLNILHRVYPPEQIFVNGHTFDNEGLAINADCLIPKSIHYTARPIPYVTAENYVRCLSQSCYLLAEHVLENQLIPLEVNVEEFRQAAENYELYYRSMAMTFHERIAVGERFTMRFVLKNWREIKRMQDFILFTFTNHRTVISGEMSFVFAPKP